MSAPRRRTRIAPEGTVVAYARVSTDEQAASGAGLDAQRIAVEAEAQRRGWTVVGWHADEGISGGKGVEHRPGLAAAIEAVESGRAAGLLAAKLDRVSRSVLDTASPHGAGAARWLGAGHLRSGDRHEHPRRRGHRLDDGRVQSAGAASHLSAHP